MFASSRAYAGWNEIRESLRAEKTQSVTITMGSTALNIALPAGWKRGVEDAVQKYPSATFFPSDGVHGRDDDKILLQVFPVDSLGENRTPMKFMLLLNAARKGCTPPNRLHKAVAVAGSTSSDLFAAVLGCAVIDVPMDSLNSPSGDMSVNLAIRSEDQMVLIRRIFKGTPFQSSQPPISLEELQEVASKFASSVHLCSQYSSHADCSASK